MNIFEMYYKNGKTAGFWVQRDGCKTHVAKVVSIAGFTSGTLTGQGKFPFFAKARDHVLAEIYEIDKPESTTEIKLTRVAPTGSPSHDNPMLERLTLPGTEEYTAIDYDGLNVHVKRLDGDFEPIDAGRLKLFRTLDPTPEERLADVRADFKKHRPKRLPKGLLDRCEPMVGQFSGTHVDFEKDLEMFVITFPYNEKLVYTLKKLKPKLRMFDKANEHWKVDMSCVDTVNEIIEMSKCIPYFKK